MNTNTLARQFAQPVMLPKSCMTHTYLFHIPHSTFHIGIEYSFAVLWSKEVSALFVYSHSALFGDSLVRTVYAFFLTRKTVSSFMILWPKLCWEKMMFYQMNHPDRVFKWWCEIVLDSYTATYFILMTVLTKLFIRRQPSSLIATEYYTVAFKWDECLSPHNYKWIYFSSFKHAAVL